MINAYYFSINEIFTFCTIVSEKNNPGRAILEGITNRVLASYNDYLTDFDSVVNLSGSNFTAVEVQERTLLQNCYISPNGTFPLLRALIFSRQPDVLKSSCPYCLLGWPGTIDHYVGQTEFPEFSILFKNLIPCCDNCNRIKGDYWRENGVRRILHFYNDTFIQHRFLYAKIVHHRGASAPKFHFYLKRPVTITATEFKTIKGHFARFDLLTKYNERANALISSEIVTLKQSRADGRAKASLVEDLKRTYDNLAIDFGVNYWQGVISDTIASTHRIINSL
jgi:hypothetical protein